MATRIRHGPVIQAIVESSAGAVITGLIDASPLRHLRSFTAKEIGSEGLKNGRQHNHRTLSFPGASER